MGYWPPPSAKAFDPVCRPLKTKMVARADLEAYLGPLDGPTRDFVASQDPVRVPDDLDHPLYQIVSRSPLAKYRGALVAYLLLIDRRPPPGPGTYTTNERLKGPFSPEITFTRRFYGDLADGGLPPDQVMPDGAIIVSYWDLSDASFPRRKCVTYRPMSSLVGSGAEDQAQGHKPYSNEVGVASRVMQWNYDQGKWEEEGADAEREIVASSAEIMSAVLLVLKIVTGFVPVLGPFYAQAIQLATDAWKLELAHFAPNSGPITLENIFSSLGADSIGLVGSFGGIQVGVKADGKTPLTQGDIISKAAEDAFVGTMAKLKAYPVVSDFLTVGANAVDHGTAFVAGVYGVAQAYGVGNIKVEPDAVRTFVQQEVLGMRPPPVTIETKVAVAEGEPTPAEMNPQDYRRVAWDAACYSYAYVDPVDKLRARRNAVLAYRDILGGNSATIVTPGEEGGIVAHGVEETEESALDVGTAHDQYLSQIFANQIQADLYRKNVLQVSSEKFKPAVDPFHGQSPRVPLDALVRQLQTKYNLR